MKKMLFLLWLASAGAHSAQFVCASDSDTVSIASKGGYINKIPKRVTFIVDTEKGFKALDELHIVPGLPEFVGSCRFQGSKEFRCDGYDVWGWRIMAREDDGIGFRFSVTAQSFMVVGAWGGSCSAI